MVIAVHRDYINIPRVKEIDFEFRYFWTMQTCMQMRNAKMLLWKFLIGFSSQVIHSMSWTLLVDKTTVHRITQSVASQPNGLSGHWCLMT